MTKVIVITDGKGHLLGTVRSDAVKTESGTIEFVKRPAPEFQYHDLDVSEDVLRQPTQNLHEYLDKELKRLNLN